MRVVPLEWRKSPCFLLSAFLCAGQQQHVLLRDIFLLFDKRHKSFGTRSTCLGYREFLIHTEKRNSTSLVSWNEKCFVLGEREALGGVHENIRVSCFHLVAVELVPGSWRMPVCEIESFYIQFHFSKAFKLFWIQSFYGHSSLPCTVFFTLVEFLRGKRPKLVEKTKILDLFENENYVKPIWEPMKTTFKILKYIQSF